MIVIIKILIKLWACLSSRFVLHEDIEDGAHDHYHLPPSPLIASLDTGSPESDVTTVLGMARAMLGGYPKGNTVGSRGPLK